MPPLQEIKYLETGLRRYRDEYPCAYEAERPIWTILKSVVRNKSFSRTVDHRFYGVVQKLAAGQGLDFVLYDELFCLANGKIVGDISPGYASLPDFVIRQLGERYPDLKLILMIRDKT